MFSRRLVKHGTATTYTFVQVDDEGMTTGKNQRIHRLSAWRSLTNAQMIQELLCFCVHGTAA